MSGILPLRPYQADALDALDEAWKAIGNRVAVVLPTGGGKTVVFAHLSKRHLDAHPGDRVLVLVHTDELVRQAAAKILQIAPHLSVGIVKASRNEVDRDVIVASVQSLRSEKRRNMIRLGDRGLVIVDECHHATANTYRTILEHFGCMAPNPHEGLCYEGSCDMFCDCGTVERHRGDGCLCAPYRGKPPTLTVGFTATLMRGDGGPLGDIWQGVAFQRDIGYMVRKRYLVPPHGQAIVVPDLDLASVRKTRTDFRDGDLGSAMVNSFAPDLIATAYVEHAADRKGILFAPTVASAQIMADALTEAGIPAAVISGQLGDDERRELIRKHKAGALQVLANCAVLTEGYDDPEVSCVVVARPTRSRGLYIQMVGRGLRVDPLRPYEDQDCLVLDVVGAYAQHDLRSIADLSDKPIDPAKARSGRSLIDLEDEFDRGEGVEDDDPEAQWYKGPVAARAFDPLANRDASSRWGRTEGGTYFAAAGQGAYVFLVPDADRYAVTWCTRSGSPYICPRRSHTDDCRPLHGKIGDVTEHRGLDLETAFGWADDLAVDMGETMTHRKMMMRAERNAWIGRARALGIDVPAGMRTEKLSVLVDKVLASRVVDQWVPRVVEYLDTERVERTAA
jgi:superfamily II DNA or RNA helicase